MIYDSTQLFVAVNDGKTYRGVVRTCAKASTNKCETVSNIQFTELNLIDVTGTFFTCTGDLCNGVDRLSASAARLTSRHMAFSFTLISLLTLMATYFLSQ